MPETAVTLASGPAGDRIDEFELAAARRALNLLKTRMGQRGLLDLLATDIETGNALMREHAHASNGAFRHGTTILTAQGLKAGDFLAWMNQAMTDEQVLITAHPEHYAIEDQPDGSTLIVEGYGSPTCGFYMSGWGSDQVAWADESEALLPDADYPFKKASNLALADGTIIGRVLVQFGDNDNGLTANLTAFVPTTCEPGVLEEHLRHFAVEFRNWLTAALKANA